MSPLCTPTRLLYISAALSRWGDRMWSFAIGLFLINLHPTSLVVTAAYQLITNLFTVALSGSIGRLIDRSARLPTMRLTLLIQNSSVAVASGLMVAAFELDITYYCSRTLFFVFMALVTALGVVSSLSSAATATIVQRDWIVVMAAGDSRKLGNINATMRRIDQVCLLLAPILAGAFVTGLSTTWAAGLIAAWNILSFFFEQSLLSAVYAQVPGLAHKEAEEKPAGVENAKSSSSSIQAIRSSASAYVSSFKVFWSQRVALPGFCLSLVYLTVLGFDSIFVGYLRLSSVKDLYIGLAMAAGAFFGVLGTVVYAPLNKRHGPGAVGLLGAAGLILCYGVCASSLLLPTSHLTLNTTTTANSSDCLSGVEEILQGTGSVSTSTLLLLAGVITIRFGLWLFDLAISQLFQESVPEQRRNTVGGVQNSLNSFFNCTYITLTLILPEVTQFGILIGVSCVACIGSSLLYIGWFFLAGRSKSGGEREEGEKAYEVAVVAEGDLSTEEPSREAKESSTEPTDL